MTRGRRTDKTFTEGPQSTGRREQEKNITNSDRKYSVFTNKSSQDPCESFDNSAGEETCENCNIVLQVVLQKQDIKGIFKLGDPPYQNITAGLVEDTLMTEVLLHHQKI